MIPILRFYKRAMVLSQWSKDTKRGLAEFGARSDRAELDCLSSFSIHPLYRVLNSFERALATTFWRGALFFLWSDWGGSL